MGIPLIGNGFTPQGAFPIDTRYLQGTVADRDSIPAGAVEEGLQVYVSDNDTLYIYRGTTGTNNVSDWHTIGTGQGITNLSSFNTNELVEGTTNLYYTEARVSSNSAVVANTAKRSYPQADETKLDGIEAGAQVNVGVEFTQGEKDKLGDVESNATADQSAAEIKTAYESNSDTNEFTDTEKQKLDDLVPVSANPGGTGNSNLDTIEINGTNYNIAGSGGTGGGTQTVISIISPALIISDVEDSIHEGINRVINLPEFVGYTLTTLDAVNVDSNADLSVVESTTDNGGNGSVTITTAAALATEFTSEIRVTATYTRGDNDSVSVTDSFDITGYLPWYTSGFSTEPATALNNSALTRVDRRINAGNPDDNWFIGEFTPTNGYVVINAPSSIDFGNLNLSIGHVAFFSASELTGSSSAGYTSWCIGDGTSTTEHVAITVGNLPANTGNGIPGERGPAGPEGPGLDQDTRDAIAANTAKVGISTTQVTDIGLNNTHRATTTGNPHSVTAADVGANRQMSVTGTNFTTLTNPNEINVSGSSVSLSPDGGGGVEISIDHIPISDDSGNTVADTNTFANLDSIRFASSTLALDGTDTSTRRLIVTPTSTQDSIEAAITDDPAFRTSIGLGNVDDTSDDDKPISTATQTALNLKANIDPLAGNIIHTYELLDDGNIIIPAQEQVEIPDGPIGTRIIKNVSDENRTLYRASSAYTFAVGNIAGSGIPSASQEDLAGAVAHEDWELIVPGLVTPDNQVGFLSGNNTNLSTVGVVPVTENTGTILTGWTAAHSSVTDNFRVIIAPSTTADSNTDIVGGDRVIIFADGVRQFATLGTGGITANSLEGTFDTVTGADRLTGIVSIQRVVDANRYINSPITVQGSDTVISGGVNLPDVTTGTLGTANTVLGRDSDGNLVEAVVMGASGTGQTEAEVNAQINAIRTNSSTLTFPDGQTFTGGSGTSTPATRAPQPVWAGSNSSITTVTFPSTGFVVYTNVDIEQDVQLDNLGTFASGDLTIPAGTYEISTGIIIDQSGAATNQRVGLAAGFRYSSASVTATNDMGGEGGYIRNFSSFSNDADAHHIRIITFTEETTVRPVYGARPQATSLPAFSIPANGLQLRVKRLDQAAISGGGSSVGTDTGVVVLGSGVGAPTMVPAGAIVYADENTQYYNISGVSQALNNTTPATAFSTTNTWRRVGDGAYEGGRNLVATDAGTNTVTLTLTAAVAVANSLASIVIPNTSPVASSFEIGATSGITSPNSTITVRRITRTGGTFSGSTTIDVVLSNTAVTSIPAGDLDFTLPASTTVTGTLITSRLVAGDGEGTDSPVIILDDDVVVNGSITADNFPGSGSTSSRNLTATDATASVTTITTADSNSTAGASSITINAPTSGITRGSTITTLATYSDPTARDSAITGTVDRIDSATAMRVRYNSIEALDIPSGTSLTFTISATTTATGVLLAGDLIANDDLTVGNDVTIGADLIVQDDIRVDDDVTILSLSGTGTRAVGVTEDGMLTVSGVPSGSGSTHITDVDGDTITSTPSQDSTFIPINGRYTIPDNRHSANAADIPLGSIFRMTSASSVGLQVFTVIERVTGALIAIPQFAGQQHGPVTITTSADLEFVYRDRVRINADSETTGSSHLSGQVSIGADLLVEDDIDADNIYAQRAIRAGGLAGSGTRTLGVDPTGLLTTTGVPGAGAISAVSGADTLSTGITSIVQGNGITFNEVSPDQITIQLTDSGSSTGAANLSATTDTTDVVVTTGLSTATLSGSTLRITGISTTGIRVGYKVNLSSFATDNPEIIVQGVVRSILSSNTLNLTVDTLGTVSIPGGSTLTFEAAPTTTVDGVLIADDIYATDDLFIRSDTTVDADLIVRDDLRVRGDVEIQSLTPTTGTVALGIGNDGLLTTTGVPSGGTTTQVEFEEEFTVTTSIAVSNPQTIFTSADEATRFIEALPATGSVTVDLNGISYTFSDVGNFARDDEEVNYLTGTGGTVAPAWPTNTTGVALVADARENLNILRIGGGLIGNQDAANETTLSVSLEDDDVPSTIARLSDLPPTQVITSGDEGDVATMQGAVIAVNAGADTEISPFIRVSGDTASAAFVLENIIPFLNEFSMSGTNFTGTATRPFISPTTFTTDREAMVTASGRTVTVPVGTNITISSTGAITFGGITGLGSSFTVQNISAHQGATTILHTDQQLDVIGNRRFRVDTDGHGVLELPCHSQGDLVNFSANFLNTNLSIPQNANVAITETTGVNVGLTGEVQFALSGGISGSYSANTILVSDISTADSTTISALNSHYALLVTDTHRVFMYSSADVVAGLLVYQIVNAYRAGSDDALTPTESATQLTVDSLRNAQAYVLTTREALDLNAQHTAQAISIAHRQGDAVTNVPLIIDQFFFGSPIVNYTWISETAHDGIGTIATRVFFFAANSAFRVGQTIAFDGDADVVGVITAVTPGITETLYEAVPSRESFGGATSAARTLGSVTVSATATDTTVTPNLLYHGSTSLTVGTVANIEQTALTITEANGTTTLKFPQNGVAFEPNATIPSTASAIDLTTLYDGRDYYQISGASGGGNVISGGSIPGSGIGTNGNTTTIPDGGVFVKTDGTAETWVVTDSSGTAQVDPIYGTTEYDMGDIPSLGSTAAFPQVIAWNNAAGVTINVGGTVYGQGNYGTVVDEHLKGTVEVAAGTRANAAQLIELFDCSTAVPDAAVGAVNVNGLTNNAGDIITVRFELTDDTGYLVTGIAPRAGTASQGIMLLRRLDQVAVGLTAPVYPATAVGNSMYPTTTAFAPASLVASTTSTLSGTGMFRYNSGTGDNGNWNAITNNPIVT